MTIWLAGKSIADIVKIPIDLHAGRLDVTPSEFNQVYDIDAHLFHYQLIPANSSEFNAFGLNISEYYGTTGYIPHTFKAASGNFQEFEYWSIHIWDGIPAEFRDIIFFHEIVESINLEKGLSLSEAHKIARVADKEYRKKYLSKKEQAEFSRIILE